MMFFRGFYYVILLRILFDIEVRIYRVWGNECVLKISRFLGFKDGEEFIVMMRFKDLKFLLVFGGVNFVLILK